MNILEVKKLRISFRTNNGLVKALRDISFELKKGETLAVVGESGSGKSVTSKAILGISAGNAVIEGGEILYDGKDILKLAEKDMYKIRGDKISMIFQDPLSSLNPIVKIGKQITEALILKNDDSRKGARRDFNEMLLFLKKNMLEGLDSEKKNKIEEVMKTFNDFCVRSCELESEYNDSYNKVLEIISKLEEYLFKIEKNLITNDVEYLKYIYNKLKNINNYYLIMDNDEKVEEFKNEIYKIINKKELENKIVLLNDLKKFLTEVINKDKPDFFCLGYYLYKNPKEDVFNNDIEDLNFFLEKYLNDNFLKEFLEFEKIALLNSFKKSLEYKKEVINELKKFKESIVIDEFGRKELIRKSKIIAVLVEKSINYLDIKKDNLAFTFKSSISQELKDYSSDKKDNIIPKIDRLIDKYQQDINDSNQYDVNKASLELVEYFKDKASLYVKKITAAIAKEKAIKLMEEVGIPEPRMRYYQYPFEFSGGMRQRIVIAIALASNPDILICDEPTTALDVTIQAQILELINKLKKERNLSVIFITHDLGVVANMADRVIVMYAGKIVEFGLSEEIFYDPKHPYTWALLSSMPDLETTEKLEAIPGTPPNMINPPIGDSFALRSKYAMKIDFLKEPPLFKITDTHFAATWLLHPNAKKVEMPRIIQNRIERMKNKRGVLDG